MRSSAKNHQTCERADARARALKVVKALIAEGRAYAAPMTPLGGRHDGEVGGGRRLGLKHKMVKLNRHSAGHLVGRYDLRWNPISGSRFDLAKAVL